MRALDTDSIILATHNAGKLAEIRELVEPFGLTVTSAADHDLPEPVEDGCSFEQNAYIKAWAAASATGMVALSDDSGLCVRPLDGAPGIYTADWAEKPDGSGRDFQYAMEKIEKALNHRGLMPEDSWDREAYFCAVLCLCWPDGHAEYFRGTVEGHLVWPPRGEAGFGYDPIFRPTGHGRTFGEMTAAEKHAWQPGKRGLSHRARAFGSLANSLLVPRKKLKYEEIDMWADHIRTEIIGISMGAYEYEVVHALIKYFEDSDNENIMTGVAFGIAHASRRFGKFDEIARKKVIQFSEGDPDNDILEGAIEIMNDDIEFFVNSKNAKKT